LAHSLNTSLKTLISISELTAQVDGNQNICIQSFFLLLFLLLEFIFAKYVW
jgi:hypothetical protein